MAQQTHTESSTAMQKPDINLPLLGLMQYNRFSGNPPVLTALKPGQVRTPDEVLSDAAEAFESETGYPWLVQVPFSPVLDLLDKLESQNKQLHAQLEKAQAQAKSGPTVQTNPQTNLKH